MNPRFLLLAGALLCCAPARAADPCRWPDPATGPPASGPPCADPPTGGAARPGPTVVAPPPLRPAAAPGEVIVRWRTPPAPQLDARLLPVRGRADSALRGGRFVDPRTEVLHVEPGTEAAAIAALEARDDVEYAERNYARRAALTPSDELYPLQWYLGAMQVEAAWDLTVGAEATVVAVIDTGVRNQHPELVGRLLPGYDFISKPLDSGDGDGRDPDPSEPVPPGFNPAEPEATGTGFHGTHITGLIAALADNARGIAGVNWRCRILPLRVLGVNGGVGFDADISAAIRWAVGLEVPGVPQNANPAQVINLSFASPGYNKTLSSAIGEAMSAGAVVVASAGNGDDNNVGMDARDFYPAAVSGVITVGATDLNNQIASYSNFGQVVFIMAPGGAMGQLLPVPYKGETRKAGIVSTIFNAADSSYGYTMTQGTSQAAALVSGVASLMLSVNPALKQSGVADILAATADKGSSCAQGCGHGLINAYAAVERARATAGQTPGGGTVYGVSCAVAAPPTSTPPLGLLLALLAATSWRGSRAAHAAAHRPGGRRCRRPAPRAPRPASRPR